jgi:hypothetical protein
MMSQGIVLIDVLGARSNKKPAEVRVFLSPWSALATQLVGQGPPISRFKPA